MARTLTCAESEELIALAALGVLPVADAADLEGHFRGCARCRSTAQVFSRASATLADSLDLLEPPAELRRRLLAAVYGSAAAPARPKRRIGNLWKHVPQARWLTAGGALAAAVATALAVLLARPSQSSVPRVFAVTAAAGQLSAHGTLTYYAATAQSVLDVAGLPSAGNVPGAKVYEVWLITRSGSAQPATFLSPSSGGGWTAVVRGDVLRFQALAATLEPAGGEPQPTGPQIFSVAIGAT